MLLCKEIQTKQCMYAFDYVCISLFAQTLLICIVFVSFTVFTELPTVHVE